MEENKTRYLETEMISYYAPEFSEHDLLEIQKYEEQVANGIQLFALPFCFIILSNVVSVNAAEKVINNPSTTRTWSQFAKDWSGISVLLNRDISGTAKTLQATRTLTGATSTICLFLAPLAGEFEGRMFKAVENTYACSTLTYGFAWIAGKFFKK